MGSSKEQIEFPGDCKAGVQAGLPFNFLIYHLNPFKDELATKSCSVERKASILYNTGDRIDLKPTAPQPLPERRATDMLFWKQSVFLPLT